MGRIIKPGLRLPPDYVHASVLAFGIVFSIRILKYHGRREAREGNGTQARDMPSFLSENCFLFPDI